MGGYQNKKTWHISQPKWLVFTCQLQNANYRYIVIIYCTYEAGGRIPPPHFSHVLLYIPPKEKKFHPALDYVILYVLMSGHVGDASSDASLPK